MIEARMPDGTALRFPDGTADAVIEKAAASHLASLGVENLPLKPALSDVLSTPEATSADVPLQPQGSDAAVSKRVEASGPAWKSAGETVGRVGSAAAEAYQSTPPVLTPEARSAVERGGPVGNFIVSPLAQIAGAGLGAINALGGATSAGIGEIANALGQPSLGRDVNMGLQILPAAGPIHPMLPRQGVVPEMLPPGPAQLAARFPPEAEPRAPTPAFVPPDAVRPPERLVTESRPPPPPEPPAFVPPPARPPGELPPNTLAPGEQPRPAAAADGTPTAREPQPQSVGAAGTPFDLAKMDLDETKAARTTAEWQELLKPTEKGDTTEHVLGVRPTKAEIEQTAPVSTESKLLRQEFREPYSEDEASKMETIRNRLEDTAGTATVVNSMERARDAKAARQRDAIWANKGEADTAPLYKYQADMLASEDGARPLVRNVVDRVIKELTDADGNPITDPQRLYGVRKHIDDLIAEQGASGKPANERAMAQLLGMKKVLDQQVIEPAAPGFMKYLSDYHEASKPIDVMKYLQEKVPGLMTGPNRTITFSKFDKFMKDLAIERAQKDYGGAEAMDDATRQTLMGIWRHLQRSASDQELAKVNGSDTTQRMMQLLRSGAVQSAIHTGVGYATGGLGNVFVPILGEQFQRSRQMKKVQQHLNPDLSQYPTTPQNPLGPTP